MVAVIEPAQVSEPTQALAARLADPRVAESLQLLLDHADLLAVLVVGLHGFVSRSETIGEAVADGVSELRAITAPAGLPDLADLRLAGQRLMALSGPLLDLLPTIEHLLRSDLADTRVIDTAALASRAVVRGAAAADADQARVTGVRALLRALKDEDVGRALGFVLSIAKALGQELRASQQPTR